jgi:hypothetical protein
MLLARGGGFDGGVPRLDVLVALAADASADVRQAAEETLARLPDRQYMEFLEAPGLEEPIIRRLVDPARVRPALLPLLLTHPAVPLNAVTALASQAGPELVAILLSHLDILQTPVLMALKTNPAYLDAQKRTAAASTARAEEQRRVSRQDQEKAAAQQQLVQMIALSASGESDAATGASESLRGIADDELLDLLAATTLAEPIARHFLEPASIRPALLPLLLGHPDTPQDAIVSLAARAGADVVPILLDQLDLLRTASLVALRDNPTYLLWQKQPPPEGYVIEVDLLDLLIQEMESDRPVSEEQIQEALAGAEGAQNEEAAGSLTNKIARMKVAQRVKLALLGTREERGMLIRDPSRVVWRAVLSSPKLTEAEVETFAALKNVSQDLLRSISMNRKFMKDYVVLKNLVMNPRTAIDVTLPLLNRLLPNDLRAAAASKDIPDTTRKMAQKLIRSRNG